MKRLHIDLAGSTAKRFNALMVKHNTLDPAVIVRRALAIYDALVFGMAAGDQLFVHKANGTLVKIELDND